MVPDRPPFPGLARSGGVAALLIALMVFLAPSAGAQEIREVSLPQPRHTLGVETGYIFVPFGARDPYGWPSGGGLFYEWRPFPAVPGAHLGASATAYFFHPLEAVYGSSWMLQPGAYAGYDLLVGEGSGLAWSPGLYAGYKHYIRLHRLSEEAYLTYRPVLAAGLRLKLWIGRRLVVAAGGEYDLIFDNTVRHTVALTQRLGLRLGGGNP